MPFIDQHQIVAFKGFHRDRLVAHLVAQLVDVDDLNKAYGFVLIKELRTTKARQLQFLQMLARQAFIGREQNDLVRVSVLATVLEVMQVLVDVDVQQQGFAAAGGVPECQLVQFIRIKWLKAMLGLVVRHQSGVVGLHSFIQAIQQLLALVEIPVQVNLGEQQREILEILHVEHGAFHLVAALGDGIPMLHDVQVVTAQIVRADAIHFKQILVQFVEKPGLAVLVDAFVPVFTEAELQGVQGAAFEKAHHPLVEHQLLVEAALRHYTPSTANMRLRNSGSIWRIFRVLVIPPSVSRLVNTAGMLWSPLI